MQSGLIARELRQKVLISARMRVGGAQVDCCIREVSLRGLLVQSAAPPTRGTYIEILHPGHLIVARVVWTNGRRFGVTTRERLNVTALVRQPTIPRRLQTRQPAPKTQPSIDINHSRQVEQNRHRSTRLQFSFVAACGALAAVALAAGVHQHLNRTLGAVSEKFDPVQ